MGPRKKLLGGESNAKKMKMEYEDPQPRDEPREPVEHTSDHKPQADTVKPADSAVKAANGEPKILLLVAVPFVFLFWFGLTQLLDIYLAPGRIFGGA